MIIDFIIQKQNTLQGLYLNLESTQYIIYILIVKIIKFNASVF